MDGNKWPARWWYNAGWDNLNDDNALLLETDMEMLGFQVRNYHTSTTRCGGETLQTMR